MLKERISVIFEQKLRSKAILTRKFKFPPEHIQNVLDSDNCNPNHHSFHFRFITHQVITQSEGIRRLNIQEAKSCLELLKVLAETNQFLCLFLPIYQNLRRLFLRFQSVLLNSICEGVMSNQTKMARNSIVFSVCLFGKTRKEKRTENQRLISLDVGAGRSRSQKGGPQQSRVSTVPFDVFAPAKRLCAKTVRVDRLATSPRAPNCSAREEVVGDLSTLKTVCSAAAAVISRRTRSYLGKRRPCRCYALVA